MKFKKEHLIEWLLVVHKGWLNEGWEFWSYHNKDYNCVKIRKKYEDGEYQFNEDGYKYESIFPSMEKTRDYLFFTSKGYDIKL